MRKLEGVVVVREEINGGYINDKGKVIHEKQYKYYPKSKESALKLVKEDETLTIMGDAYEVFDTYNAKKRRRVVYQEEVKEETEVVKKGRKKKSDIETEEENL